MNNILQRALSIFKDDPKPLVEKSVPTGEVAWSESQVYGSRDFQKYNPDTLIGTRGFRIYRKMMLDEQVKAVVHFKRDAITSRQWYFEFDDEQKEALGEEEAERRVKVFTLAVKKMPGSFVDGLNAMMSAMYHGYSLTEKVYDQRPLPEVDGKEYVVLKALKMRPFDTFNFYPDVYGNVEKLTQTVDFREQEVDITRFVHFVCNPDVDPHYGQSELREAYRAWFSKDHAIKFRNIFLERMAGGLISLETEKGVTITTGSPAHTDIMNLLANVQTKTGWLLPAGIKANIHYPGGKNENYEAAIAADDKAIAKALLVPPLLGLSEQGSVGAYSQSQTQLEAFMWTLDSTSTRLAEACNEQLFAEVGDLNFGDGIYPRFCFHPLSESMKHAIIGKWKDLVTAGAVEATDTDEQHLRELLDFPDKGEPIKQAQPIDPRTGLPIQQPVYDSLNKDESKNKFGFDPDQARDQQGRWTNSGGGLTGEAQAIVSSYKGTGYYDINSKLRSGKFGDLSSSQQTSVRALDHLTLQGRVESDTLYRVVEGKRAGDKYLRVGATVKDPAFLSTSTKESYAHSAVRDAGARTSSTLTTIKIIGTKGTPGFDLESHRIGGSIIKPMGNEGEYLLPRNTELKILQIDEKRNVTAAIVRKSTKSSTNEKWIGSGKTISLQRATKRVDFAVIDQKSMALEVGSLGRLTEVMKDIAQDLIAQTKDKGLTTQLADELKIKASLKAKVRATVERALREAWNLGQDHAKREVEKALASAAPETKQLTRATMAAKSLTETAADLFLEQRSYQIAGDVSENLRKRVVTTLFNGIKNSWSLDEVVTRISDEVDSYSIPQLNTIVRTSTFEAMNEARYNFFSTPELGGFVEALEYSAILDGRTTDLCRELDGKIYPADSDIWNTYRPPNHFNCRSLLIAVTQLDTWRESEAPELLPAEGFG